MKDKLVTLIGGGGFLGRYVAQELLARGARVRIAQPRPRDAWFLKPLGGLGQIQFVAADIRKPETLSRAFQGSDAVVNLVGILSGDFRAIHVDGARNVAEAAAAAGVASLVHISALGADVQSESNYGKTKGEGEIAVRAAYPTATILRPSILFGVEDRFVNRFAGMIAAASLVPLVPVVPVVRAEVQFQPAYVVDVARAVVESLADPQTHGAKTYSLGGPERISMIDLLRWIGETTGKKVVFAELPDALGSLLSYLPMGPITRDQWKMLQADNVVPEAEEGFAAFGIAPKPLASVAPPWLVRYREKGRFGLGISAA